MTIFYGWWIIIASYLIGLFVAGTIFYGFTAFMDPLMAEFGWSSAQVSFASSLRGLEMGIFAPLIGILMDRYNSKVIIFSGIVYMKLFITIRIIS